MNADKEFVRIMSSNFGRREFLGSAIAAGAALSLRANPPATKVPYPFVDGLCPDIPEDANEIRESSLSGFLLDVSVVEPVKTPDGSPKWIRSYEPTLKKMAGIHDFLRKTPTAFHATDGREIRNAFKKQNTAIFFQLQGGGEIVGEDLDRVTVLRELGLRVLQMTHHNNNPLAGGGIERSPSGLTKLGFEAVARLNADNVIPDLSHASDQTALDVLKTSSKPVILSHGAARAIVNNARCTPDEVIRGIANSGGIMGVFMMSFWLTNDAEPTVEHYIKQIKHVANVGGIDAVGIANDFPLSGEQALIAAKGNNAVAVKDYLPWWNSIARMGVLGFDREPTHVAIPELNNIDRVPKIYKALRRAGFKRSELEKIMGRNWIRVLTI